MATYRNMYQYETSPRKLQPEYEVRKNPNVGKKSSTLSNKKAQKKKKIRLKNHTRAVLYLVVGFVILFAISYRNSLITASFDKKESLKKELAVLEKENAQLEVNMENSLNLNNIEKAAKEKLGMQKLDESQKVYVNLPKEDYVEPASEQVIVEENTNWFTNLINKIFGK